MQLTNNQKRSAETIMLRLCAQHGPMPAKPLILATVTHCPFANRHNACGILSGLVKQHQLFYYVGWVF